MAIDIGFDSYLSRETDRHNDSLDEHREDCDSWDGGECNCLDLDREERDEVLIARGEDRELYREERGY